MDDEGDVPSLGSRKSTLPAGVSFQEWHKILDVDIDTNGEATPRPSRARQMRRPSVGGSQTASDQVRSGGPEGEGENADGNRPRAAVDSNAHDTSAEAVPRRVATSASKISLYIRSDSDGTPANTTTDHLLSDADDLPPPLMIGLKSVTSRSDSDTFNQSTDPAQLQMGGSVTENRPRPPWQSAEIERADREVIVGRTSSEELSIGTPTPLGSTRRVSLFDRVSNATDDENPSVVGPVVGKTLGDAGVDDTEIEAGLKGGPEQQPLSSGQGTYSTVLRDWLIHVFENDDQYDAKVQNIWAAARRQRRLAHKTFEAADYELYDSKVWHMHKRETVSKTRRGTLGIKRHRKHFARKLTVALGVAVGLSGCFVTYFTNTIIENKLHFVAHVIEQHEGESGLRRFGMAFGWLWFFNITLAAGAFALVVYKPWSSGSGIPETKCVLNGVSIPQVLSLSTLMCKLGGVILGVASGLPIGKEGPMIHAGAAIGGSIANLPRTKGLSHFRNDRDRRDFAAIGTAAGVAAAFRTPIGGVLFTIEEGASFWSTILTWRSFAAAIVTVVVYYLVFHGKDMFTRPLAAEDIFTFGQFGDEDSRFYMWELTVFALIATLGGCVGAMFVACNKRLDLFRARCLSGPRRRFIELAFVSTLTSSISFFLPLAMGECRKIPTDVYDWSPAGVESLHHLVTLNCHEGYYNELGSMFLNEQDRVIKLLFHFGAPGLRPGTVLLFSLVFIILECMSIGMWVCSGLFIPSLLAGAAMGRGLGALLGRNSRTYALIGAAGVLGGIARMTLSLTVMLVEASGWVLFIIPLMLVLLVARSVGNSFNEGIYDTQIGIKKMPFLEQEPPEETKARNLRANQLMSKEVVCLRPIETVAAVMSALREYDHNCFPVVEDRHQRVLLGTIHRKNLSVLLKYRHFTAPSPQDPRSGSVELTSARNSCQWLSRLELMKELRPNCSLPALSWDTLEGSYPNYPKLHELKVGEQDMNCLMDIARYVQIGPHVINEHASAHRAYITFRTLGLRHLVVVNHYNEVTGMITREDLLPEHFERGGAYHTTGGTDCRADKAKHREHL